MPLLRSSSGLLLAVTFLADCNKPTASPAGAGPAGSPVAASTEWKPFDFPNGGFTVEAPGSPVIDPGSSDQDSTAYRSQGDGFSVGIFLQKMLEESPEKEIELHASAAPINFPGATSKPITHEGLPGIDVRYPPYRNGGVTLSRYLYLNGKEIHLQFNVPKDAEENALAPQRDRFFNSLKVKK